MKVRPSVKPMCDKCKVIKRNGNIISELEKNINLKNKDVILVFGNIKTIKKLFKRNKEIENK